MSAQAQESDFQRVGSLSELRSGGAFAASIDGRPIAVFEVDGAVIATQGRCPHARGPLHEGELLGETLTCPWHGYSFSLRTGVCDDDASLNLQRFEVRIDGDEILVKL